MFVKTQTITDQAISPQRKKYKKICSPSIPKTKSKTSNKNLTYKAVKKEYYTNTCDA